MFPPFANRIDAHDGFQFRCPTDLQRTRAVPRRVLVIGVCTASHLVGMLSHDYGVSSDFVHIAAMGDPEARPPRPIEEYDLQIVVLPLDHIMQPHSYFSMRHSDPAADAQRLEDSTDKMTRLLENSLRWSRGVGLPTLVGNFLAPQINPVGRFLPRYDLRNPRYFIEQLNQRLTRSVEAEPAAHLLDLDGISATFGRKYVQDDFVWSDSHGAFATDVDFDLAEASTQRDHPRIEPLGRLSDYFTSGTHQALRAVCEEILSMVRSIRQADAVKLVVIDLDDTAWRGIAAEQRHSVDTMRTGWPLGFIEALMYLKRRGVLLAILSKNDMDRATEAWNHAYGDLFALSNFTAMRIDWNAKPQNMAAILRDTNLLPASVLYIDDNPAERAAIAQAFPDLRVIGANPYYLRRILLWSAELQQVSITDESDRRTEMVQGQITREATRQAMSQDAFLNSLDLRIAGHVVTDVQDARFPRLFELVNKTNQFNTNGRRWSRSDFVQGFAAGLAGHVFEVADRFSNYGIVCVALRSGPVIEQVVMSCRVIGLGVETAAIAVVEAAARSAGSAEMVARARATDANILSRTLFEACGYMPDGPDWRRPLAAPRDMPAHVRMHQEAPQPAD